jgi:hypothetical protein
MDETTTIRLRKATRDRLKALGRKGETYDDVLRRLLPRPRETDSEEREREA